MQRVFILTLSLVMLLTMDVKSRESAIEAVVAKKKLETQRHEMKMFMMMHYGQNAWNDVLAMEGQIRKQRQKEIYERQALIRKMWEYVGWVVLFCSIVGFIILLAWLWKEKRG